MSLLFIGDMSFNNKIMKNIEKNQTLPFEHIENLFSRFSGVIGNLESPLTSLENPERNKVTLRSTPKAVEIIKNANIKNVSVANNHLLDFGIRGFNETLKSLKEGSVDSFGYSGNTYNVISYKDRKIGIIGICTEESNPIYQIDGNNILDEVKEDYLKEEIVKMKSEIVDFVVVFIHWGDEYINYPNENQKYLGRKCVDYGADIVIGHHPHVVQSIETYKNKKIYYSLGNFIFADINSRFEEKTFYAKQYFFNRISFGVEIDVVDRELEVKSLKYFYFNLEGQVKLISSTLGSMSFKMYLTMLNTLSRIDVYVRFIYKTKNIRYLIRNYLGSEDKNIFSANNRIKIRRTIDNWKKTN